MSFVDLHYFDEFDATVDEDEDADVPDMPRCRVCGCTDDFACEGGCIWAEADLCSRCAREGYA